MNVSKLTNLETLAVYAAPSLTKVKGIGRLKKLSSLYINESKTKSINLSANKKLNDLYVYNSKITSMIFRQIKNWTR